VDLELTTLTRDLALNVVALVVLVFAVYYRRHRRWEAVVGYVAFNLCLFTVAAALVASNTLTVGVGFGLFAVLSIVRLRSDESNQAEIGYTMVALVLGLLTGLPGLDFEYKVLLAVVLVGAMFIVDSARLTPVDRHRATVLVDRLLAHPEDARSVLSERLGGRVESYTIREVDYVRETTTVDVVWRAEPPVGRDGNADEHVGDVSANGRRRSSWRR
jgi:hypothetical protein